MLNQFPLWKNITLIILLISAIIYALPNIYGEDPAIQITGNTSQAKITPALTAHIQQILETQKLNYQSITTEDNSLIIHFSNTDNQLKAVTAIKAAVGNNYTAAMNLIPATPRWLQMINAKPVTLGLDLRGGIHFLLDVDVNSVVQRRLEGMTKSIIDNMRSQLIRYSNLQVQKSAQIIMQFRDSDNLDKAYSLLLRQYPNLNLTKSSENNNYQIIATPSPAFMQELRQNTMEQTLTTLRNRVNELGIAEPEVQQQGATRIVVNLPGIQDSARAKQILGGTATLEFHLVDSEHDVGSVLATGVLPPGSRIYKMKDGSPILLKSQVVLSGDSITSAASTFGDDGRPIVVISLGGGGEAYFTKVTRDNVGNRMAIVYVDTKTSDQIINGKVEKVHKRVETVISAPVIQTALGSQFQITGINDPIEARNLALLLRAGAMPANIDIVEERTIGPSLGMENIRMGVLSVEVAFILIVFFMAIYYRVFGLVADIALLLNLIFIIALLSILGATLTLPGIAGIVLTVGMAVDANVLINERIREELRNGMSVQASIHAGFERAFATIVDANVTTLIVAIVLFSFGTGPIKGFAVTLTIGIITSLLTAVTFTRGLINLIYGGRTVKSLSIGI